MTRLRKALEDYYASPGSDDPILIRLPDRSARTFASDPSVRWILATPRISNSQVLIPAEGTAKGDPIPPDFAGFRAFALHCRFSNSRYAEFAQHFAHFDGDSFRVCHGCFGIPPFRNSQ
jgi:hypothetical protein